MDGTVRRLWLAALVSLALLSGCVLQLHWHLHLKGSDHEQTLELDEWPEDLPGDDLRGTPWDLIFPGLDIGSGGRNIRVDHHELDRDRSPERRQETGAEVTP